MPMFVGLPLASTMGYLCCLVGVSSYISFCGKDACKAVLLGRGNHTSAALLP